MNAHSKSRLVEALVNVPAEVLEEFRQDFDVDAFVAIIDEALAEQNQLEEMVSYRQNVTGIPNTVFISGKGRVRHAPRIKVAINPSTSLDPSGTNASIDIHSGQRVAGEDVPAELQRQLTRFIELNREALLDYWEYRIDTDMLRSRLRSIAE